ncbi:TPA: sigma-70 family RNA polymerase sigma factor, partial [Streptococcus pyogenes]
MFKVFEQEKHLEQVDKKNHLLFFSSLNYDG